MNKHLIAILLSMLFVACANQVSPTGGEKDTNPPALIKTIPANESVQFNYNSIYLEFDEFIQFTYPNPAFSITPALPDPPTVTLRNKSITITLPDSLLPNTTYQINFGNAIKDLNEGNELSNYAYVFSTGDYIDSLTLKTKVIDAKNQSPIENVVVGLFSPLWSDSMITNQKPLYYKKSNKEGEANFSYLKKDSFQVIAFSDKNNDLIFQPHSESVGFSPEFLPSSKDSPVEMLKFNAPSALTFTLSSQQKGPGQLIIKSSRSIEKENIYISNVDTFQVRQLGADSFQVFFLPTNLDSLLLKAVSANQDSVADTIRLRTFAAPDSLFTLLLPNYQLRNDSLIITFPRQNPILSIDNQLFSIHLDSIQQSTQPIGLEPLTFAIYPIPFEDSIRVTLQKSALIDWYSSANKKLNSTYVVPPKNTFGQLVVNVEPTLIKEKERFQIQLIDANGVIIQTIWNSKKWLVKEIMPGEYSLRILIDKNGNGYWDKGRFAERQLPEPFLYHTQPITIRANWENNLSVGKE